MTDLKPEDLARLQEIAEKATPGDLDTAEHHDVNEDMDCPLCGGEGLVPGSTFTNYDGHAVGVQFFGVGEQFGLNEAFHRAFTPAVALSLLADRARMEKAVELLCEVYEAARDVSMAAVQDDDGEWSIKGDPEAMLGRLYLATEEVRKVTKGASQ